METNFFRMQNFGNCAKLCYINKSNKLEEFELKIKILKPEN